MLLSNTNENGMKIVLQQRKLFTRSKDTVGLIFFFSSFIYSDAYELCSLKLSLTIPEIFHPFWLLYEGDGYVWMALAICASEIKTWFPFLKTVAPSGREQDQNMQHILEQDGDSLVTWVNTSQSKGKWIVIKTFVLVTRKCLLVSS